MLKIEKKVEDLQEQLKELRSKKPRWKTFEIINTVRAMVMDKDQIMAFLSTMKGRTAARYDKRRCLTMRKKKKRFRLLTVILTLWMLACSLSR